MKKGDILENLSDFGPHEGTVSVIANIDASELSGEGVSAGEDWVPILPLRNAMLFPGTLMPVSVGRESSQALVEEAEDRKRVIGVFGQMNEEVETPAEEDLYRTGVLGKVVKILKLPDGSQTAFLQGFGRVRLVEARRADRYMVGRVEDFCGRTAEGWRQAVSWQRRKLARRWPTSTHRGAMS